METVTTSESRLFSARSHLLALVVAIFVPVLLFSGILLFRVAAAERAAIEQDSRDAVHDLTTAVDRELLGLEYTLLAMSAAPSLKIDDLQSFHTFAVQVAQARNATFVLRDTESRQILNSAIPWGQPVPTATTLKDADVEAARTGKVIVSNLFIGLVVNRPLLAVVAPLVRDGKTAGFLSLSTSAAQIGDVLTRANLDEHQVAAVVDRSGIVVARSQRNQDYVGTRARRDLESSLSEGVVRGPDRDGVPIVTFFQRSAMSGWFVTVSVPEAALSAPLRRSIWLLATTGIGLGLLSLLGAWLVARRFSEPLRALSRMAAGVVSGQPMPSLDTSVYEIKVVRDVLASSSDDLQASIRERDDAEAALKQLNGTLEEQVRDRTHELTVSNSRLMQEMQQRQETEERFRHLQKIEAVGQLTGGIAHDFNNMLAVILGSLKLLQRKRERGDNDIDRLVSAAVEGGERAAQLTKRLLAFSRQQSLSPAPVDVNRLITGMSELLQRTITESVTIETVLAAGLWRSHADPNQLENAVINLAVNARDAMPDGGKLTIETTNAFLDERYAAMHADVTSGAYVLVAVTDTGTGMSEQMIERVFDPFFTTKPVGQGTGLGLSQVHGFIKQSGGHVKIYSEVGHGTTVKIYLPRFFGEAASGDISAPKSVVEAVPMATGNEIILVVEDEDRVRGVSTEMLRELGYRVVEASSAVAGLRALDANPDIRLLFTDVVMPDLNGRKLADEALVRRPDLKVIFTTGYTRNAIVHNGILDPGVHLVIKPFTIDALAQKIRAVLDA